jgi:hypothetical protein
MIEIRGGYDKIDNEYLRITLSWYVFPQMALK